MSDNESASGTTEPQPSGECGGHGPCPCCVALAHVRMPWVFQAPSPLAPQNSSEHFSTPYLSPYVIPPYGAYPYGYHPPQAPQTAQQCEDEGDDDTSESKTQFFKFPGFQRKPNSQARKKKNAKQQKITEEPQAQSKSSRSHSRSTEHESESESESDTENDSASNTESQNNETPQAHTDDASDTSQTSTESQTGWHEEEEEPDLSIPKPKRMWHGLDGIAVSAIGIGIPSILLAASCASAPKRLTLVLLNHPLESMTELLLIAAIPVVNFMVWRAICKGKPLSRKLNVALGANIATATIVSAISIAGLIWGQKDLADSIGTDFSAGFTWIAFLTLAAAGISAYMLNRLRKGWILPESRMRMVTLALAGALISTGAFAISEYRPWCVRLAEHLAVSANPKERQEGMTWLRQLNPERELRMECSDARAAGLAGLFIPMKSSTQHQLYFSLTGTPYSFREFANTDMSSMPDDYLSRHVVGDRVPGLGLTRSNLSGAVHTDTLSSTLDWTFVLKNGSSTAQEARAEIGLPPGAAITGLTVWNRGESQTATFVASDKVSGVQNVQNVDHNSPAIVTDLGHGRVLLHCYPVLEAAELKVSVRLVVPLKPDGTSEAMLALPRIIASNFDLDGEHVLRLRSEEKLSCSQSNLTSGVSPAGQKILSGLMTNKQLEDTTFFVTAKRSGSLKPVAVLDRMAVQLREEDQKRAEEKRRQAEANANSSNNNKLGEVVLMIDGSKGVKSQLEELQKMLNRKSEAGKKKQIKPRIKTILPQYVVQDLEKVVAPAPKHLVVVVDGSAAMKDYVGEVESALKKLPTGIPTSVIVASQEQPTLMQPTPLKPRLAGLKDIQFIGGQDNLQAVVKAAELAGETKGGAVLWIHGPQPVINEEIYIMAPYTAAPSFYEVAVGAGTDTFEFFKNHTEIGPFSPVPRNSTKMVDDLAAFFGKWKPDSNEVVVGMSQQTKLTNETVIGGDEGQELVMLNAIRECNKAIAEHKLRKAARIAVSYNFVSPVSTALVGGTAATTETDDDAVMDTNSSTTESADGAETGAQTASDQETTAPTLQGATNGTIGPQGGDATVIQGVNTAGTVRVNNLANLEALLNIIANLAEILCLAGGAGLAVHGFAVKSVTSFGEEFELGPGGRIVLGILLAASGLITPGLLNWFIASARDANLFS